MIGIFAANYSPPAVVAAGGQRHSPGGHRVARAEAAKVPQNKRLWVAAAGSGRLPHSQAVVAAEGAATTPETDADSASLLEKSPTFEKCPSLSDTFEGTAEVAANKAADTPAVLDFFQNHPILSDALSANHPTAPPGSLPAIYAYTANFL